MIKKERKNAYIRSEEKNGKKRHILPCRAYLLFSLFIFLFSFVIFSCGLSGSDETTLTINLSGSARSSLPWPPDDSMLPDILFDVTLTCGSVNIHLTAKGNSRIKAAVSAGFWEVILKAYYMDELYASGSNSVDVKAGRENSVWVDMYKAFDDPPVDTEDEFFTVTMGDDGNGSSSASLYSAIPGAEITISAQANANYVFGEWEIIAGDITLSSLNANPAKFIMPDEDVIIKAKFINIEISFVITGNEDKTYNALAQQVTVAYGENKDGDLVTAEQAGNINVTYVNEEGVNIDLPVNAGIYGILVTTDGGSRYPAIGDPVNIGSFKINPKAVTITGTGAQSKVYDGNTAAAVTGESIIEGNLDGVNLTVAAGTASFENKNAGTGKAVAFSGFSLAGSAAGNYTLTAQPADTTADITLRPVTITGINADRAYNGTAAVTLTDGVLQNIVADDDVEIDSDTLTGVISSANTGTYTVTGINIKLTGSDAGNYELTQPDVTAVISKAESPAAASPPVKVEGTTDTIMVVSELMNAPEEQADIEYACNTVNSVEGIAWTGSAMFTGLDASAVYWFFARAKESENYNAGEPSEGAAISTSLISEVVLYWLNEEENLITFSGASVVASGGTLVITASGGGYTGHEWYINGVKDSAQTGVSYNFSAVGKEAGSVHIISLIVTKDGRLYSANFTVTVTN